ncbi:MAG: carbohydrate ABC transporter permease [Eubacterium sp.]|nr:carbohydrate ABC transporter permease [Eubacterium sp.]
MKYIIDEEEERERLEEEEQKQEEENEKKKGKRILKIGGFTFKSERKNRRKGKISLGRKILLTVIAAFFAISFLLPTILTFANSFMSEQEISSNYGIIFNDYSNKASYSDEERTTTYRSETVNLKLIPDKVVFSQYETVLFKSPDYLMKFWNSVFLTFPIMIFQIAIALGAAYSFARFRGKVREIIFFLYLILMLMPYQVTLVPNYLVSDYLGLLDTRWSIILPGIFAPFSVYLLTKYMRRIPESLIEAAKLDGANEWNIFWKVAIPICKGPIVSVAILVFIDYWNMVEQPIIMLSDSAYHPLSVFLSQINNGEIGLAFAVATIYMVPPILIFLYGEEYLVDGIAYSGSVKG